MPAGVYLTLTCKNDNVLCGTKHVVGQKIRVLDCRSHRSHQLNIIYYYSRRLYRSAWVERSRLSVCLSVCPQHKSKTNDPKVFKLGVGNDLGID